MIEKQANFHKVIDWLIDKFKGSYTEILNKQLNRDSNSALTNSFNHLGPLKLEKKPNIDIEFAMLELEPVWAVKTISFEIDVQGIEMSAPTL